MRKIDREDMALCERAQTRVREEAQAAAECLACLTEIDRTRAWARLGNPSLFDFCHQKLDLSRAESFNRIKLVRLVRERSELLAWLRKGDTLAAALRMLAPYLTAETLDSTAQRLAGLGISEVEEFRNQLNAAQDLVRSRIRKVTFSPEAVGGPGGPLSLPILAPSEEPAIAQVATGTETPPNANGRATDAGCGRQHYNETSRCGVRIAVTLTEGAWKKYERVCDLSNRGRGGSELAPVFEMLLDDFLKRRDPSLKTPRSSTATDRQEATSRAIPAAVKHEVWRRDGGQCSFVHPVTQQRCPSRRGLQFDHIKPYAWDGPSNTATNIRLLCPAHNRMMAEQSFGRSKIEKEIGIKDKFSGQSGHVSNVVTQCATKER